MATHLGLHRCPTRYPNFDIAEGQMRRRTFWSIYCLERMLAQSLGVPLDMHDSDIDVCLPDHEVHLSNGQNRQSKQRSRGEYLEHRRSYGLTDSQRFKTPAAAADLLGKTF